MNFNRGFFFKFEYFTMEFIDIYNFIDNENDKINKKN